MLSNLWLQHGKIPSEEAAQDLQLRKPLAELPRIWADPVNGVLANVELLQRPQSVQPALVYFC